MIDQIKKALELSKSTNPKDQDDFWILVEDHAVEWLEEMIKADAAVNQLCGEIAKVLKECRELLEPNELDALLEEK